MKSILGTFATICTTGRERVILKTGKKATSEEVEQLIASNLHTISQQSNCAQFRASIES